ncbi:zinc finger protein [Macleaya cordata]|uniref:Protein FAR1-RELATED SEQUENCE n=1 Tax=Macleaya cordata TaxID=56857 RepID=A0A200PRE8_MACCD|nr:zinc finger protein [Macleaya cordata]
MEKQVQDVYTISKFEEFQNELTGKMYCDMASVKADGASSEYQISEDVKMGETKKSVNFKVLFNEYYNEVKCSCCMYEFRGIMCRHAIYALIRHKIHLLPDKYIMQRWRKDVKRCHTWVKISCDDWNATPEAHRCDKMLKTFNEIKELANYSEDKCMVVMDWMDKLKEALLNHEGDCGNNRPIPKSPTSRSSGNDANGISNENMNLFTPNYSVGGYGMGNITRPIFYENHF